MHCADCAQPLFIALHQLVNLSTVLALLSCCMRAVLQVALPHCFPSKIYRGVGTLQVFHAAHQMANLWTAYGICQFFIILMLIFRWGSQLLLLLLLLHAAGPPAWARFVWFHLTSMAPQVRAALMALCPVLPTFARPHPASACLLACRLLAMWSFQSKVGIIITSLQLAMSGLLHHTLLLGLVALMLANGVFILLGAQGVEQVGGSGMQAWHASACKHATVHAMIVVLLVTDVPCLWLSHSASSLQPHECLHARSHAHMLACDGLHLIVMPEVQLVHLLCPLACSCHHWTAASSRWC